MFRRCPYTNEQIILSKAEELELIRAYQKDRLDSQAERLLKARATWVQSVISNFRSGSHVCMDTAFSDAMVAVYGALSTYDEFKSSLSTYLYRVIWNAYADSSRHQDINAEQHVPEAVLDEVEDLSECIAEVKRAVNEASHADMNDQTRKVAHWLLKGYDEARIGEVLMINKRQAAAVVAAVRRYIAWLMVRRGRSCEPIILDEDLLKLAMEHEESNPSCW